MATLAVKDPNTSLLSSNQSNDMKNQTCSSESLEHQQDAKNPADKPKYILEQKLKGHNGKPNENSYVSPSDAIMSPASHKLAGFKQRQLDKTAARSKTARTLFGRTSTEN